MCLVWRYRLVASIVLTVAFCDVFATETQQIGKVYPRGNHWAVGHLMGKKSTDEEFGPEAVGGDDVTSVTTDQDLQLDRLIKNLLYALVRGQAAPDDTQQTFRAQNLFRNLQTKTRQMQEDHRPDKLVAELIQALRMQDDYES